MRHHRLRAFVAAAALAAYLPIVAACASPGTGPPQSPTEQNIERIDAAWTLAKAGSTVYVVTCALQPSSSICSPAVVAGVTKALDVGDVAVSEAKASIVAAGSDRSALQKATALGLSAIAVFQKAVLTYGMTTVPDSS